MKRTHIIIILAFVIGLYSNFISAQKQPIGTWKVFPTYSTPAQKVVETTDLVYYLTGGNLFSYDKKNDESYSYTTENKLNDNNITDIYYNHEKKYLVVCYESGNIDLLYDNGRVKNMSDIMDSSVTPPLTITNVFFDGDFIYVGTAFGIVKFNEPRAEVVTSGNYGKKINSLCVMGNRLVIHSDDCFKWIDKNSPLNDESRFTRLYNHNEPYEMIPVSDNQMFVALKHPQYVLALHTINFENGNMVGWNTFTSYHNVVPKYIIHGSDETIYYVADNTLYKVTDDITEEKVVEFPEEYDASYSSTLSGKESMWILNHQGLGNFSFDGEGGVTVNTDYMHPNACTVGKVRYFYTSWVNNRLYAQNSGITAYRFGGSTRGLDVAQTCGYMDLDNGGYKDITAYPVYAKAPIIQTQQRIYGNYAISPTGFAEDPTDTSICFVATADDGIYKVKDGQVIGRYDSDNSPLLLNDNRHIVYGISVDKAGNLWVIINTKAYTNSPLMVLPADKVKLDPAEINEEDWYHPDLKDDDYWGGMDVKIFHCKKSNMVFIIQSSGELFAYDTRGTLNNFKDDRIRLWEGFTDQDGKEFKPNFLSAICEDNNGKVWIGSNEGLIEISPSNALNPNMTVTRIKVPRNDGSNLADYLLGTDLTMDISVDAANRKWIATYGSGLYCVSSSGNEIIHNFTSDNSPLVTDKINCVYADKAIGTIYIGTDLGLMSYTSDATPSKENYDDILVYPNPVKPEYRGDVNITGLMDNSLVKIADVSGNVVAQGRSEGGRYVWNVCNSAGVRVKTGVYYVMVSQNATGSSTAAVAKIMVIN